MFDCNKRNLQIREYAAQSGSGPVGADAAFQVSFFHYIRPQKIKYFQQERADIQERLSRTYGGGDMESFPALDFVEPDLHQDAIDGERTIDIQVGA